MNLRTSKDGSLIVTVSVPPLFSACLTAMLPPDENHTDRERIAIWIEKQLALSIMRTCGAPLHDQVKP